MRIHMTLFFGLTMLCLGCDEGTTGGAGGIVRGQLMHVHQAIPVPNLEATERSVSGAGTLAQIHSMHCRWPILGMIPMHC